MGPRIFSSAAKESKLFILKLFKAGIPAFCTHINVGAFVAMENLYIGAFTNAELTLRNSRLPFEKKASLYCNFYDDLGFMHFIYIPNVF